jgi:menaquinone-dependent protoporphyrinogen oxidase
MASILIVYATTDGQTRKICQRLEQVIEQQGHRVVLVAVQEAGGIDPAAFDKIVIGASVRYGRHSPLIVDFIEQNRPILESRPSAFFSVNVVARKPEKSRPEQNPYLQKFLRTISWKPKHLAVIAGKIDYPSYRPLDRLMIRLIMWMTKGPTDPAAVIEFTDWAQVEAFGRVIAEMETPAHAGAAQRHPS